MVHERHQGAAIPSPASWTTAFIAGGPVTVPGLSLGLVSPPELPHAAHRRGSINLFGRVNSSGRRTFRPEPISGFSLHIWTCLSVQTFYEQQVLHEGTPWRPAEIWVMRCACDRWASQYARHATSCLYSSKPASTVLVDLSPRMKAASCTVPLLKGHQGCCETYLPC